MTTDEQVRERVRRVIGAIGDAALPATAFDDLDSVSAAPLCGESTRRRRAAFAVGLATAAAAAITGIVLVRADSDADFDLLQTATPPTADDDGPAESVPSSEVPATAMSDAVRRAAVALDAAAGIDGPWYYLDLDAARPDHATFMVPDTIAGFSTSVWASDDGS